MPPIGGKFADFPTAPPFSVTGGSGRGAAVVLQRSPHDRATGEINRHGGAAERTATRSGTPVLRAADASLANAPRASTTLLRFPTLSLGPSVNSRASRRLGRGRLIHEGESISVGESTRVDHSTAERMRARWRTARARVSNRTAHHLSTTDRSS